MIDEEYNKDNRLNSGHAAFVKQEIDPSTEDQPLARGYQVLVDDNFHFMDESERYCAGVFATYEEALALAKRIVEEFFTESPPDPARSAEDLTESYQSFGDDPWIAAFGGAPEPAERFSAWDYAGEVAQLIVNRLPNDKPQEGEGS